MAGARTSLCGLAGVVALGVTCASAADYPSPYQPPQQQIIIQQPPVGSDFSDGWYLRGHVGVGMTNGYDITSSATPAGGSFVSNSISDQIFIGGGIGLEWNSWLRLEATAEYRSKARISALGTFGGGGGAVFVDQFEGQMKSWIFLANAFVDLGTWNCFTPFVGAGIGAALNSVSDFTDVSPTVPGATGSSFGIGRGSSQWNLAWALYAGVSYNVTKTFKVDLTYRYLDYGSAGDTIDCNGGCGPGDRLTFRGLSSHDIMLGFRWACCDFAPPPPPVVYTPPPPIRSKG
jgi:opacity protein-like surface antigen